MQLDPKLLALPDFTVEEIQRCIDVTEPGMFETGLIVDANNLCYRLAFAASKDCADANDMLAVFVDRIKAVVKDINSDVAVCCIDSGVPLRRSMLGAAKKPDKTPEQEVVVDMAREALHLLRAAGWERHPWLNPRWQDGYEADDLCAAWAVSGHFVHSVIYSTDSDLYQVTNGGGIVQLSPATGAFVKSEVPPVLVPGVKALMGDTSDNVVGIKGVGPVTALKIMTGEKTMELDKETERRVRNNLMLTALPFPGSYQILQGAPLVSVASFNEAQPDQQYEMEDDEPLPF
jgi:5'-3' exonuclease